MRLGFGWRRVSRFAAGVLALVAGTAAAPAAAPVNPAWTADPDEQFMLDVQLRQRVFGDGVRAYNTPEGTCVLLGDFLAALDVPMKIDLGAHRASGWAFRETNRISIDQAARSVSYGGRTEALAATTIREVPEGWCVGAEALGRWFGLGIRPVTGGSVLLVTSEAKLPVELAKERRERAARLHKASFDLSSLPQVRVPYRMWRTPALDFVVDAGATYDAHSGVRVDRRASLVAAGEALGLSVDARLTTTSRGRPQTLRMKAFRSDPDGGLLGPLHATTLAAGDVESFGDAFTGNNVSAGRGLLLTNRPLAQPLAFDRTALSGELPSGWEAELYRNGELIAFAPATSDNRYRFDDVQLLYGDNRLEVISYGPQGQVRSRIETINVGEQSVPPGRTWYWAGINQPGRDLLSFGHAATGPPAATLLGDPPASLLQGGALATTDPPPREGLRAAVSVEHGLDQRTSVAALVQTLTVDDRRVTFVEGAVRRSIGPALVEAGIAADDRGGLAFRAQALARVGSVNLSAQTIVGRDFRARGAGALAQEHRLALDAPLKLGRTTIPLHGDLRFAEMAGGDRLLSANLRSSVQLNRFNLATVVQMQKTLGSGASASPGQLDLTVIGSGRIRGVRLRGAGQFDLAHGGRFRQAELSGYWSVGDTTDLETTLAWDGAAHRARARVGYIRRLSTLALALTGEAASDGSVAAGLNLVFSLSGGGERMRLSREPLATAGSVDALVFRDLNGNGVRDPGEPLEKGALITAGMQTAERPTDARGLASVGGLQLYRPVAIGIDTTTLADPMLVPAKAAQVVTPRPGVAAKVEIPLVGAGDVEGVLIKDGGGGFEGLDLELVDQAGHVVATTRTDYDGYFLFERVGYGRYALRLTRDSAQAARSPAALGDAIAVTPEKSRVRLGTIRVSATVPAKVASAR
ncbi:carboxypeptidase regulatory-like domain-containing protein [Sphingomonas ginkgonis]|uniref:Carboxypeptidase regulatory-like domain-containing protein n=1 Tax=Sphingomonas ginkgonis TaxID=2315330 RepID=A0A429V768_9SPHN|nr:carboxypeptidase regulatory-like domain-containing protein [Sphingomonas ginkgonis]RST29774.1 carboxypeptidase regulatory-like domain-containing protein [Sphingomonas ginkgonis]